MAPAMRFETRAEAAAVCERLVEAGVRAYVPDEGWSEFGVFGGSYRAHSTLWIADEDLERARRLYDAWVAEARDEARASAHRDPDFNDYDAAGSVVDLEDALLSRGPSSGLGQRTMRAVGWVISTLFLLAYLAPLLSQRPEGLAGLAAPLAGVALVALASWLRRRW